jgi:hypothetical protein
MYPGLEEYVSLVESPLGSPVSSRMREQVVVDTILTAGGRYEWQMLSKRVKARGIYGWHAARLPSPGSTEAPSFFVPSVRVMNGVEQVRVCGDRIRTNRVDSRPRGTVRWYLATSFDSRSQPTRNFPQGACWKGGLIFSTATHIANIDASIRERTRLSCGTATGVLRNRSQ